jgi:hypothetical protein
MKLKALLLTLLVAGFVTSIAVAGPPPGKGHDKGDKAGKNSGAPALTATTTTTGTSTTTTTTTAKGKKAAKVMLCHRTGSKKRPYVAILVSGNAAKAHLRHGDLPMPASGACPTTRDGGGTTTTTTTGTTQTTTTGTTESTTTATTTTTS